MKVPQCLPYISCLSLVFGACEPAQVPDQSMRPKPVGLQGQWHYDSTGIDFYDANLQHRGRTTEPRPAGELLTIGTGSWVYSGTLHEVYAYTRQGRRLRIRRIGTRQMVEQGYITAEAVGHRLYQHTSDILLLTPTRLIVRDSTGKANPNSFPAPSYTVDRFYYSR